MKFSITLLFAAAAAGVVAQDTVVATAASCEPHGDHWHCPSGIPEPTTAPGIPSASASASITAAPAASPSASHDHDHESEDHDHDHAVTASTCEPHGDHWHCPSGVAEPSTAPALSAAASTGSAPATQSTAAAVAERGVSGGGVVLAVVGAAALVL